MTTSEKVKEGWKGGSFHMTQSTQVYISEDRLATGIRCIGFQRLGKTVQVGMSVSHTA